jgi:hypothetical protein
MMHEQHACGQPRFARVGTMEDTTPETHEMAINGYSKDLPLYPAHHTIKDRAQYICNAAVMITAIICATILIAVWTT